MSVTRGIIECWPSSRWFQALGLCWFLQDILVKTSLVGVKFSHQGKGVDGIVSLPENALYRIVLRDGREMTTESV